MTRHPSLWHVTLAVLAITACSHEKATSSNQTIPRQCSYWMDDQSPRVEARFPTVSVPYSLTVNSFKDGRVPENPICLVGVSSASGGSALPDPRIVPVLFVPADVDAGNLGESGAEDVVEQRILGSLRRVQEYLRSELAAGGAGSRSFNLDRLSIVRGRQPAAAYYCEGEPVCGPGNLPARVSRELSERGHPTFSETRHQIVFMLDGGSTLATYVRSDMGGTTAILGDSLLPTMNVESLSGDGAAMAGGDWVVAQTVARMLGLGDGAGLMSDAPFDAALAFLQGPQTSPATITLSPEQASTLARSSMVTNGVMTAGAIGISDHPHTRVQGLAFGTSTMLVVYTDHTGVTSKDPLDRPSARASVGAGVVFDGVFSTQVFARLITIPAESPDPWVGLELSPEFAISELPIAGTSCLDGGAAVAYDATHDAFQVVWDRRTWIPDSADPASSVEHRIMGRRIDATTGAVMGEERILGSSGTVPLPPGAGAYVPELFINGALDLAYDTHSDSFLLVAGESRSPGTSTDQQNNRIAHGLLTSGGEALTGWMSLATSGHQPNVIYVSDPDPALRRYFVSWKTTTWSTIPPEGAVVRAETVLSHFVGKNGKPITPGNASVEAPQPITVHPSTRGAARGGPVAAYDPASRQLLVTYAAYNRNAEMGGASAILARTVDGATGTPAEKPRIVAEGFAVSGGSFDDATGVTGEQTSPSSAHVPSMGRHAISFVSDASYDRFGLVVSRTYPRLQFVNPNGSSFGPRHVLSASARNTRNAVVEGHPRANLAMVARSAVNGLFVDLVELSADGYEEVPACDSSASPGDPWRKVAIDDGPLTGTELSIPPELLAQCLDFHVHGGTDLASQLGCQARGPAVFVGTEQEVPWARPIGLRLPTDLPSGSLGLDERFSVRVACQLPQGPLFIHSATIPADVGPAGTIRAEVGLERPSTCQVVQCRQAVTLRDNLLALAQPGDDAVRRSCLKLKELGFFGSSGPVPGGTDFSHQFYVLSVNLDYLSLLRPLLGTVGWEQSWERVWDLWDHEYSSFTHLGTEGLELLPDLVSASFSSGNAVSVPVGDEPSTGVIGSFWNKHQWALGVTVPALPIILDIGGRLFIMGDTSGASFEHTYTAGGQTVIDVGTGFPVLDEWVPISVEAGVTSAWEAARPTTAVRWAMDEPLFDLLLGGDKEYSCLRGNAGSDKWSVILYGQCLNDKLPHYQRGLLVALSILNATGGRSPGAFDSAAMAVVLGFLKDNMAQNPYWYERDLAKACECHCSNCGFHANYTRLVTESGITSRKTTTKRFNMAVGEQFWLWDYNPNGAARKCWVTLGSDGQQNLHAYIRRSLIDSAEAPDPSATPPEPPVSSGCVTAALDADTSLQCCFGGGS